MASEPDEPRQRQVLGSFSEKPDWMGFSIFGLLAFLSPALALFVASSFAFPDGPWQIMLVLTGLAVVGAFVAIAMTPDHLSAGPYVRKIVEHHTQQPTALHDMNPETSTIEQPEPNSLIRRFARLPAVRGYPIIGSGEYEPTQELVPVKKPYRRRYAVERDDGALIGAVRITPANMSLKEEDEWQRQVDRLARVLASTVEYPAQWYNPMRSVDFSDRRARFKHRERDLLEAATDATDADSELSRRLLADVAGERAAVIGLHQDTTMQREHYFLVAVEPKEAVTTVSSDGGGIANVPGVGAIVEWRKLRKQRGDPEHVRELLDELQRRVEDVATSVQSLEGIKATPLSSTEFSRVLANYYRTDDVYEFADFSATVRESPVPLLEDDVDRGDVLAGDPDPNVSYAHLAKNGTGDDAGGDSVSHSFAAERAARNERPSPDARRPIAGPVSPPSDASPDMIAALTPGSTAEDGIALDDDALKANYRSLLAPEIVDRSSPYHLALDGDTYSATLVIRDWPARPPIGMLESLLTYDEPGVQVTVSTHFEGKNVADELQKLKSAETSLRLKAEHAEERDSPLADRKRDQWEAARDVKRSVERADTGLFETNTYIEIRCGDTDRLRDVVRKTKSRLKELNASAKELTYNHLKGWQTAAPACKNDVHDDVKMTGDGLAALLPWVSDNLVEPRGVEIGTHAERNEPTVVDLRQRSTGYNMGIFGTIGSGKTTTLKTFLLRQKLLDEDVRLVLCDPLQEFAGLTEALDGERVIIGGNTHINPLHIEAESEEAMNRRAADDEYTPVSDAKVRAMTFVKTFYGNEAGLSLGRKQGVWRKAIKEAYDRAGYREYEDGTVTFGEDPPTLQDVFTIIREMVSDPGKFVDDTLDEDTETVSDWKQRAIDVINNDIQAFERGEVYHNLTKPTDIDLEGNDVVYLDLQRYNSDANRGLMMQLLVSQIYERVKSSSVPTLFAIDESHYMTKHSSDLAFLKQTVRHSRHYNLSVIFSTQTVSEFFATNEDGGLTDTAEVILDNMSIQIYQYLKEMDAGFADELDLTEAEVDYIKNAASGKEGQGYSEALLRVDEEGSYPIRVEMSDSLNPCEFALVRYDPTKHGDDLYRWLADQTDDWRWQRPPRGATVDHGGADDTDGQTVDAPEDRADRRPVEADD
ncbi:VirB4 family type IV secretion system protein [Halegenticoccus tardaugens]|uniref:VirB4 family type IV secretion system protein n=1 Tax=Halegenticoccus tardaugens TaxID=2071624 RepID=UPI00100BE3EF|nr:DUF87 domain-containing protein [Halegenticoccus tardaugens]